MRSAAVPVLIAAVPLGGCALDHEDFDERADKVVRAYLRAAADGDAERLCALRTDGAVRRWGGKAACERQAEGIAIDPLRAAVSMGLRERLREKAAAIRPSEASVVDVETSTAGEDARAVIDYGEAVLDDGRVVGGEILEMDLKLRGDGYKVVRLGFAAHAD